MGKYSVINGLYRLSPLRHESRPCWASCHDVPFYLFHTGKSRWVISKILGDSSTCFAFVKDDGKGSPAGCRPWMRCDDNGTWNDDPCLACAEDAPEAAQHTL